MIQRAINERRTSELGRIALAFWLTLHSAAGPENWNFFSYLRQLPCQFPEEIANHKPLIRSVLVCSRRPQLLSSLSPGQSSSSVASSEM